jgi:hypothetical protein
MRRVRGGPLVRDYAKIAPKAWQGDTFKALRKRGPEPLLVGLYLTSSPQSNMLGLFSQPILYMAHETGLGEDGARKGLAVCIEVGFCSYDEESEFVWVHEMASYQIAPVLKASDLRCKGIQKDYDALPRNPFLGAFFDRYAEAFHLTSRRDGQGASTPPPKPLRSQEQEQEQEQEQDSSSLRSEETGANKSRLPRPKREDVTLSRYLETCKAENRKPLPPDHHIRTYCRDAGISEEMLQVGWVVFRRKYTEDQKGKGKRYKDWPGTFANAVREGWLKLWYVDTPTGEVRYTSTGLLEKANLDAKARAREQGAHDGA